MKFNKWTLGLAAVGAVSLTSVAQAEEKMMLGSQAAAGLTSTTISGYVDTSAHWNIGRNNGGAPASDYSFGGGANKQDGFNLNVVQVSLAKALDESEWASGYRADFWFGPDANTLASNSGGVSSDFAIRQAYVALRTPVGNGIDWKMGVFDTIVGYETIESGNNPNYTRSYGYSMEPTTHTGLLGTYRFCDSVSASAGIANTFGPGINSRTTTAGGGEDYKTYMGSVALTAPSDWGWVAGSSLYVGAIQGFDSATSVANKRGHYYAGLTLATPVAGLKVGTAFDYSHEKNQAPTVTPVNIENSYAYALYASFQATEKLSLHGRAELLHTQNADGANSNTDVYAWTLTAQYDLWKNVISRAELRWDHNENSVYSVNGGTDKNAFLAALNIIYKF